MSFLTIRGTESGILLKNQAYTPEEVGTNVEFFSNSCPEYKGSLKINLFANFSNFHLSGHQLWSQAETVFSSKALSG